MLGLITDRTQENVDYLQSLSRKGWANMTSYERAMWTGDPLTAADCGYTAPVNILPNRVHSSDNVSVSFRNSYFVVTGTGTATIIVGTADHFIGTTVTLAIAQMSGIGDLELIWYNGEDDYTDAHCSLTDSGVISTRLDAAAETWDYLAVRIHAQGIVQYHQVMLELGNARHDYVPYTPILPTEATKGAYNYSDLNRVEMAVEELSDRWNLGLPTKTDWSMWDVPKLSDMSRFRGNLAVLAIHCGTEGAMDSIPTDLSNFTYTHANAIENFLLEASEEV